MSYVYCLATMNEPVRTYIGATVDVDRRLSQHNGERSGGARATGVRGGEWYRVCYVSGFTDWSEALSFEWHWKHFSHGRPRRGRRAGGQQGDPLERRQKGLDACLEWCRNKELVIHYE